MCVQTHEWCVYVSVSIHGVCPYTREKERDRETERDRQTDRQRQTQRNRQTEREREREPNSRKVDGPTRKPLSLKVCRTAVVVHDRDVAVVDVEAFVHTLWVIRLGRNECGDVECNMRDISEPCTHVPCGVGGYNNRE